MQPAQANDGRWELPLGPQTRRPAVSADHGHLLHDVALSHQLTETGLQLPTLEKLRARLKPQNGLECHSGP